MSKKILKIYQVYGMMEWMCEITSKKWKLTIPFTNGTMTATGVTPATYSTDDPVKQAIIENSEYFKSNKILLRSSSELTEEETRIMRNAETAPVAQAAESVAESAAVSEQESGAFAEEESYIPEPSAVQTSEAKVEAEASEAASVEMRKVAVSDIAEAKDYLAENCGVSRNILRGSKSILAAAKANGIEFEGI